MNYIIYEMQTNAGITSIVTPTVLADYDQALHAFYLAVAAATVSTVEVHTIIIVTEDGRLLDKKTFRHAPAPATEEV